MTRSHRVSTLLLTALLLAACGDDATSPSADPWCEALLLPPADNTVPADYAATGSGEVGEPAPLFSAVDACGDEIGLDRFFGRLVLLDLAATWCPHCRTEAEAAAAMAERLRSDGLPFVLLQVLAGDSTEDPAALARSWAETWGLVDPVLAGAGAVHAGTLYELSAYPTHLILGPDLRVLDRFTGGDAAAIEARVRAAWENLPSGP